MATANIPVYSDSSAHHDEHHKAAPDGRNEVPPESSEVDRTLEHVKGQRTAAKRAVTMAAKRLRTGIERRMITVNDMARDLDDKYCDFLEICDKFTTMTLNGDPAEAVVNGLGPHDYERETESVYRDAADHYRSVAESKPVSLLRKPVESFKSELQQETDVKVLENIGNQTWLQRPPSPLLTPTSYPLRVTSAPITSHFHPTSYTPMTTSAHTPFQASSYVPMVTAFPNQPMPPHFMQTPSNLNPPLVQLKRREIPRFSGKRSDWPEFKAQWQQLVVPAVRNPVALASDLKTACRDGLAWKEIENISAGAPAAYDQMWESLCLFYDNVTLSVDAAMADLTRIKKVKEGDHEGTIELIRTVEKTYNQLAVLQQVDLVTNREIAGVVAHLPPLLAREWAEVQYQLHPNQQLRPFRHFYAFLKEKRPMLRYLADAAHASKGEWTNNGAKPAKVYRVSAASSSPSSPTSSSESSSSDSKCPLHPKTDNHTIEECYAFKNMTVEKRREVVMKKKMCFVCLGLSHVRKECEKVSECGKCQDNHHELLCLRATGDRNPSQSLSGQKTPTHAFTTQNQKGESPLYAIYGVPVTSSSKKAIVFCDDGSEATFIAKSAVRKLGARKLYPTRIEMATLTSTEEVDTHIYEVTLISKAGKKHPVKAIALPEITGEAAQLDIKVLASIFTDFDCASLQRPKGQIDILLGSDYFGLHPKHELDSNGENLSIMEGSLGVCVQGFHAGVKEESVFNHSVRVVTSHFINTMCGPSHPQLSGSCQESRSTLAQKESVRKEAHQVSTKPFLLAEDLGTTVDPRCGACKCGKCPLPGHTYSFREEQELKEIRENLLYDEENACWTTSYPWLVDPAQLPDNYRAALATLKSTEKRLKADPLWAEKYSMQILDMAERGVARQLTPEEMNAWTGPIFYLSHLAVENPKSTTTPVRIVFNSSQPYRGVSLNSCLAKGPDSYRTNLLGVLLRFREEKVVLIGDIRKMYNSVHLAILEQHTHRFLWRNMEDRAPDVWCVTRVNMGDKPAGAIAVEAKDLTAERFKEVSPEAASLIVESAYVDDLVDSVAEEQKARSLAADAEKILEKGGFKLKEWFFGGVGVDNKDESGVLQVLGVHWDPREDVIQFKPVLNFSRKRRGLRVGPPLTRDQLPDALPSTLTRRIVLEQVMGIYDPLGILAPFLLQAKILLRETWSEKLDWDDPLPSRMTENWKQFFIDLYELDSVAYQRCLRPSGAVGDPELVILSDGSELAYGCAAYVRWTLEDGTFWCRLVMGKCRIAPVNRVSIPQMELNGAVLSKRIRQVITKECRYSFSNILHLIDSETVLKMIHKVSTRFKVYEGVRVGEIQAATEGDLSCWGWVPGKLNIADWVTRCHSPKDLGAESDWYKGPVFLYRPMSEWDVKFHPGSSDGPLPGEKRNVNVSLAKVEAVVDSYKRCSQLSTIRWALARILNMFKVRSFAGGRRTHVTPELLKEAELLLVKEAQSSWSAKTVKEQFRDLHPVVQNGIWVVGTRVSHASPFTPENKPQALIPYNHPLCVKLMEECHRTGGHKGRDATLGRFRARFWTSRASKLSMKVCKSCQICKMVKIKGVQQVMGQIPQERLSPAPPFAYTMIDLFGPFSVRGEVQRRISAKAWGVIFTDLCCRAIHLEVANGYDAQSFLLAFRRFTSVRGWPVIVYSDPGTQLRASADVICQASTNGTKWEFSPADSPWRQGAVEALIKTVKQGFQLATQGSRLSVPEALTILGEVANLVNERPIGIMSGSDSVLSVLTPNSLLLGRSTAANPGGYGGCGTLYARHTLVENIVQQFWEQWTQLYAPTLLKHTKWKDEYRNLQVGDVVLVMDNINTSFRGKYRLARVKETYPGDDGIVRKVKLALKNFKVGEKMHEYQGQPDSNIERSVQRLVLLVPVD